MPEATAVDDVFAAFVGIDWADQQHALCLQVQGSDRIERGRMDQTAEAIDQWAVDLCRRFGGRPVAVALEQKRGALVYALMKYSHLVLYPLPPARLAAYRKAFVSSGAKDDPTDARLILDYLGKHRDQLQAWRPDDALTRKLALLVEQRRRFVEQRTSMTQRLIDCLKTGFPQALDLVGEKVYSRMACDLLLKWPDLASLQRAHPQTVRQFYYAHQLRRGDVIEKRLELIRQARPLIEDAAILEVMSQSVRALAKLLRTMVDVIEGIDQQIEKLFSQHPDAALFAAAPGAGKALAPRLLCAFGSDRSRYQDAAHLQVFAGIAPVTERSGKQCLIHRRWACPHFLRQTFHEFALHSIGQCPWAKAFYQLQLDRGKKRHAAIRSLAFKWIRILFACWQTRTPYDESIYMAQLQRSDSPLLAYLATAA